MSVDDSNKCICSNGRLEPIYKGQIIHGLTSQGIVFLGLTAVGILFALDGDYVISFIFGVAVGTLIVFDVIYYKRQKSNLLKKGHSAVCSSRYAFAKTFMLYPGV